MMVTFLTVEQHVMLALPRSSVSGQYYLMLHTVTTLLYSLICYRYCKILELIFLSVRYQN